MSRAVDLIDPIIAQIPDTPADDHGHTMIGLHQHIAAALLPHLVWVGVAGAGNVDFKISEDDRNALKGVADWILVSAVGERELICAGCARDGLKVLRTQFVRYAAFAQEKMDGVGSHHE